MIVRDGPDGGDPATIHTDGACIGNPGPGGWAAVIAGDGDEREISGRAWRTTNNRMELRAAIEALDALSGPRRALLYTDSQYVRDGITRWVVNWQRNGWRTAAKQPVKNADLWRRLLAAADRHRSAGGVEWRWVRGHAGDTLNERADALANRAARAATPADAVDLDETGG